MSYFFGTAGTSGFIKAKSKKHVRHQNLFKDRGSKANTHGSTYRRNSSHKKCILTAKSTLKELQSNNCDGDNALLKNKSKCCLYNEITRLFKENHSLTGKLEGTKVQLVIRRRDKILSKLKKKYHKLEQNYYKLQTDHDKVNVLLAQQKNDFKQLYMHHEESLLVIRSNEQEHNNFVAIIQKIKNESIQMHDDINLLKILVYRLNVEIEKYQDKLRTIKQSVNTQTVVNITNKVLKDFDDKNVLKAWGKVNFHVLGPLLDAYQENINEKSELIQKYKEELDEFTGTLKCIINENDNIHIEVEDLRAKYDRYIEETKGLEKDAIIVKEQNDLLVKQFTIQKQKIQKIYSAYDQKVESISQKNNKLHKEYLACNTELHNMKDKYEVLNDGYEKLKSNSERTMPVSVYNATINECKRLFEELKQQSDSKKKISCAHIKQLEDILLENKKQLISLTAERDQLKIQSRNVKKNLKQIQFKLDHLQGAVQLFQVSYDSCKRQLSKTTLHCEELIKQQEKLNTEKKKLCRDLEKKKKETENVQYLRSNIYHRMEKLKTQLKMVQEQTKEQMSCVKKHFQNQELDIDDMKNEYQREIQRLKQLVRQKEKLILILQKEKCFTQESLELVWKAVTNNDKKIKNVLKSN